MHQNKDRTNRIDVPIVIKLTQFLKNCTIFQFFYFQNKKVIEGTNSYTAPDGQVIKLEYIADENGFQPMVTERRIFSKIFNSNVFSRVLSFIYILTHFCPFFREHIFRRHLQQIQYVKSRICFEIICVHL